MVTLGVIALFMYHAPTTNWVREHPVVLWTAIGVVIVTVISMMCCTFARRRVPINFLFLAIFTVAESILLGILSSYYNCEEVRRLKKTHFESRLQEIYLETYSFEFQVMTAVAITAGVSLGLTIFAFQTKWDFTMLGGMLIVSLIILLIFGITAMLMKEKTVSLIYASLGALIFSIHLVYDTQLMMGGDHKYSINPEEYIFAVLNLYLDIVNLFLYILLIFVQK